MKTLLLIDIQNDFLPGGALAVAEGDRVVPVANALMPRFEWVVATQDWHPAGHKSFAANHAGRKVGEVIELEGLSQVLWPVHCVQGTRGAEFAPGLMVDRIAHVTRKGMDEHIDSYSGFFDNGHRRSTDLDAFLKAKRVTDLYVMGLATDYCVKFTALDAQALGYRVHLVVNGCRGVGLKAGDVARALDEMRAAGVELLKQDELLNERDGHV
jgi:nicotinamidase/pyrazinamidase